VEVGKACIIKHHWPKCGRIEFYLSPCSLRVPEKLLSLSSLEGRNLVPMSSLIIIGNCPHFGVGLSLKALLVLSLGVVSVSCHKDVLFFLESQVTVGQRFRVKETDARWRQGGQAFILLLDNLWTQRRSRCLLTKAVSKCLLILLDVFVNIHILYLSISCFCGSTGI
jgi:hypothetical protein